jgi:hypothetical protein
MDNEGQKLKITDCIEALPLKLIFDESITNHELK